MRRAAEEAEHGAPGEEGDEQRPKAADAAERQVEELGTDLGEVEGVGSRERTILYDAPSPAKREREERKR